MSSSQADTARVDASVQLLHNIPFLGNQIMWRNVTAVLSGAMVMVLTDFMLARIAPHLSLISISTSVFIGAALAGFVAERNGWFLGLLVGTINSGIVLGLFYWVSSQVSLREHGVSMLNVVACPSSFSFVFGIIGGTLGGWLKRRTVWNAPQ
jgi:hypothetical protein